MVGTMGRVLWFLKCQCHLTFFTCSLSNCKQLSSSYGLHAIVCINATPLWELHKFLPHAVVFCLLWQLYEGLMKSSGNMCGTWRHILSNEKEYYMPSVWSPTMRSALSQNCGRWHAISWEVAVVTRGHHLTASIVFSTVQNHFPQKGSFGNRSELCELLFGG
jgi:hypothetical protein